MPSPINTPLPTSATAVNVVTTAETIAVTSGAVNMDTIESVVLIEGTLDLTVGTAGTTVTINIRRGTTVAGAVVQALGPFTVTAGNRVALPIVAIDKPGQVTGQQYVATVTVASATGNSTVNTAILSLQVQPNG